MWSLRSKGIDVQLLKGIATSDEPMSNKFMKAIDKFTSGLDIENFK